MFWTLGLILCLGIGAGVAYLYKFLILDPKKYGIPLPSDALIDQALPTEIMRIIILESDLRTLLYISEVSKYWNYLSNEHLIRDTVYKKEGSYRPTKEEFEADQLPQNFIPYDSMQWLQYDRETYPHHWLVEDLRLARQRNKKIIDAPLASIYDFQRTLGENPGILSHDVYRKMEKYLVKVRLHSVARTVTGNWKFREGDNDDVAIYVPRDKIKPEWHFLKEMPAEFMIEMTAMWPGVVWFMEILRYRPIDQRKRIAGIIPIDNWAAFWLSTLYSPCLALDFRSLSSSFQHVIYYGFAVVSLLILFGFTNRYLWRGKDVELIKGCVFFASLMTIVLTCGVIFTPWMITLKIAIFLGILHLTSLYFTNVYIYITRSHHKHAIAILGYVGIMILFVVDWKLTADALKIGTPWKTLLYNALIFVGYFIYLLYMNFARHTVYLRHLKRWSWREAIQTSEQYLLYLFTSALMTVLLALFVPNMYDLL